MTTSTDFEESLLDLFAGIEEDNLTDLSDFADNFLTQGENGGGSDGETSSSSGSSIVSLHHDRDHQLHPHYNSYHHHNNNNNDNNNPSPIMMTAMPPVLMPCYDFDSNNLYLHSNATAPLLSKSNKRVKKEVDESRLIKNRESANRSRMKRKNEKSEMEDTIVELKNRIRSLELENTALVTDNASLHNQNLYLRSLLSEREREMDPKKTHPIPTLNGTVSGITVFCLVCMCTVFNDWLPPAIRVTQGLTSSIAKVSSSSHHHHPSGRVLLSMHETPTIHMTSPYSDAIESTPQSYLRMGLLVVAVLCYFGYHQYLQRKNLQRNGYVLP